MSNKAEITAFMSTHYPDPYVWYGAVHEPDMNGQEKPHCHIVLCYPESCTVSDCAYINDEGNTSDLKWKKLRVMNGLIYPYHLKYSKTADCFVHIERKTKVLTQDCFGIISQVPDNWDGYWSYLPFTEDDLIISELDEVTSSSDLLVYLRKHKRQISTMDCRKIMDMMRVYDYLENSVKRADPSDTGTDEHMQNFLENL